MLPDPTSKYVSSAYFNMEFTEWAGWRSEAATMYEGGPTTDLCIMLADISAISEITSRILVVWLR